MGLGTTRKHLADRKALVLDRTIAGGIIMRSFPFNPKTSNYIQQCHERLVKTVCASLAFSVFVGMASVAFSAPNEVDSVNEGRNIVGGTYFNTAGGQTVFQNSTGGGLFLRNRTNIRGLESDAGGVRTGNGGSILLDAPDSVVRLDGNINVNAVRNGRIFAGNGGQVEINTAFLYQNGQISANGVNGGQVTFNVGSAILTPRARVNATGSTGNGGQVTVAGDGVINFQRGSVINTTGQTEGGVDANIISVSGGLVNNAGVLRADGLQGTAGGTIQLVASGDTSTTASDAIDAANAVDPANPIFGNRLTTTISNNITNQAGNNDGNILNSGTLSANGGFNRIGNIGGDGGTISLTAAGPLVQNTGTIRANGTNGAGVAGNGGTITLESAFSVRNTNRILANGGNGARGGNGGNGGTVSLIATDNIENAQAGQITARGGNGGAGVRGTGGTGASANGGNGGAGGTVGLTADAVVVNNGTIDIRSGAGGQAGSSAGTAGASGDLGAVAFGGDAQVINNGRILIGTQPGGAGGGSVSAAATLTRTIEQPLGLPPILIFDDGSASVGGQRLNNNELALLQQGNTIFVPTSRGLDALVNNPNFGGKNRANNTVTRSNL
jgi:hypothetical protein